MASPLAVASMVIRVGMAVRERAMDSALAASPSMSFSAGVRTAGPLSGVWATAGTVRTVTRARTAPMV